MCIVPELKMVIIGGCTGTTELVTDYQIVLLTTPAITAAS